MTGSHEQSDKMGGNSANDVEEGELPEEGEIMDEEEQQHKGKVITMKTEAEGSDRAMPTPQQQNTPSNSKTESGSKDSRGDAGGSSWRRCRDKPNSKEQMINQNIRFQR